MATLTMHAISGRRLWAKVPQIWGKCRGPLEVDKSFPFVYMAFLSKVNRD